MFNLTLRRTLTIAGSTAAVVGLVLIGNSVYAATAQDLKGVVNNVQTNIETLAPLLTIISYIAGIAFCIAGIVQFKAHKDNPAQVPLSKPLVYIGVGAALLFLPSIMQTAGSTLFGGEGGTSAAAGDTGL